MKKGPHPSQVAWAIIAFWVIVLVLVFGCTQVTVQVGKDNNVDADKGLIVKPKDKGK